MTIIHSLQVSLFDPISWMDGVGTRFFTVAPRGLRRRNLMQFADAAGCFGTDVETLDAVHSKSAASGDASAVYKDCAQTFSRIAQRTAWRENQFAPGLEM